MRRQREDRGASLVEAAFALPIFFLLVLGLVDFGLVGFNDNQAGNAARDGARVGIINYLEADVAGSADRLAIEAAVQKNLPGVSASDDGLTIEVDCIDPDDIALASCAVADVDRDRVRVRVRWNQPFASPVANALGFRTATVTGESAMVIVGAPIPGSGVSPTPCDVTGVSVTPSPVTRDGSGELQSDLAVQVTATGSCGNITVRLVQGSVDETVCLGPSCVNVPLTFAADATDQWSAGTAAVEITGDDVLSGSFTIEDPAPTPVCVVSGVSISPDPVERETDGTLKNNLAVNVAGSGPCDLEVELTAPNGSTALVCSVATCGFGNNPYSAVADSFWTAGPALAEVFVAGQATPVASTSFTVTDAPACAVSDIATEPDPVTVDKGRLPNFSGNVRLRITVTTTGPCTSIAVEVETPSGDDTVEPGCAASCSGPFVFEYTTNDSFWTTGTATVTVSGDASDSDTFEIE